MSCSADDANKIRDMLEYQEIRRDDRFKGVLSFQGLLFAALAFSWDKSEMLSVILSIVGMLGTTGLLIGSSHSDKSIKLILEWWSQNRGSYAGPPVIEPYNSSKTSKWSFFLSFNFVIGMAWGGIFGFAITDMFRL